MRQESPPCSLGMEGPSAQPNKLQVVNNIIATCSLRHGNYRLVTDILDFLQLEDSRLNVTFLTQQCEDLPSKVTEEMAMKEVLILLEKNEYDYNRILETYEEKEQLFNQQATLLTRVQEQMNTGFETIMGILSTIQNNQANSATSQIS